MTPPLQLNQAREFGHEPGQQNRVYSIHAASPCLQSDCSYGSPRIMTKAKTIATLDEVRKGVVRIINGRAYRFRIRKLTPTECCRLQGIPDWYDWGDISDTQRYRMLGNGWQVDTIKHCVSFMPKPQHPLTVLSLFDGMGCAYITLRELGIPVRTYLSSEIDKAALKAEKLNIPDIIQLGSVTDINVAEMVQKHGVPDVLFGGSPCFAAGTKVLTQQGYVNIEDITVGDLVLTHANRFREVLRTGHREAPTFRLKAQCLPDIVCTAEHPFYARRKETVPHIQEHNGKISRHTELAAPEWVKAQDLPGKYRVCYNVPTDEGSNPLNLTDEECYVLGRYIADGHTRKDLRWDDHHKGSRAWQLILSVGNRKVPQIRAKIATLHYSCYAHGQSVHRVIFSNQRLVEIAEEHCGIGSLNKHFGEMLVNLPKPLLRRVLEGYLDGDGCFTESMWKITTVSLTLALSLQRVVAKLFNRHVNITKHTPSEFGMICGRRIHQNPQYLLTFTESDTTIGKPFSTEKAVTEDGKVWCNARKLTECGTQTVYNLEVADDNSYTANNAVVHNCQSFSFSGKMQGMRTATDESVYTLPRYLELKQQGFEFEGQSYLFWEYMRILTELREYNPNIYFFLENVEMQKVWERTLSEAIGVWGVHINSALVSAQNRRRIYWSNFRVRREGLFGEAHTDIPQPDDRGILLKDILENEVQEKYYLSQPTTEKIFRLTPDEALAEYIKDDENIQR